MSVTWTKNGDSEYLVESKEHLLQIMNKGALYTDAGDAPTDYWASRYLQTSDIDLVDDHASITPIGNDTTQFTGGYDGGRFQIRNWSYSGTETFTGLFGCCWEGCVLKHIRLSGAWSLLRNSLNTRSGFLVGYLYKTSVDDVEANFDAGTAIQGNSSVGVLIGRSDHSLCHKLTLRGTVDSVEGTDDVGGLVGHLSGDLSDLEHCRNLATFPTGITGGDYTGGIIGTCMKSSFSKCLNAMQGDLSASNGAGGICGHFNLASINDSVVNSMVGNVTGTNFAGGIFGKVTVTEGYSLNGTNILNYMKGDVVGPSGAGGIMGTCVDSGSVPGDIEITKSVVAMQGNVAQSVRGTENFTPSVIEVTVDTSFGMFFDGNVYGSGTMVVDGSLVYHPQFTDLPYIDMSGTDADGNVYNWDFVFANVGGKFDHYTHLSVHTAEVSAPFYTSFGLAEDNDVVYLTYANADEQSLYIDPSLTIVETAATVVFDHAKTEVLYGTPTPATTVVWTTDADGKFEVATKEHLLQLMNKGVLYTDLGVVRPSGYWTHHYVQTAEIDLQNDAEHVVCIGDENTSFVGSFEHDGFEVLNWQHGDEHLRLFGDRTTLAWTQDAEGRYQVESVQHLLQIMERGERFVNEGDFPSDHWGASALYVQTADIDLQDWHAKIHPIGNATTNFFGQYDGNGYKISNWSYTQPENSADVTSTGLFGVVTDAEIKRLCLDGVWTLNGSAHASRYLADGFLCGTAIGSTIYDIDTNFSTGTLMAGGSSTTAPITHRVGGLIGYTSQSVVCNVTLKGTVDLKYFGVDGHNTYVGGVIGYVINAASSISLCRNLATFPNGITGKTAGGLVAYFHMGRLSASLNTMQGDVVGITHAGGICGIHVAGGSFEVVVNAMTGNIQATENAGGVHGCVDASGTGTVSSSQLLNYMSGNIEATTTGGVVGLVTRSEDTGDVSVTNSIVAMHGSVDQPVRGSETFVPSAMDAVVNTDFGMVYQKQTLEETSLTGFSTHPSFTDLPYIPLNDTDPDGAMVESDFVFANVGGKTMYSGLFTHLTLHTSKVSAPYATDFGLDSANTKVYLTYANLDKSEIFVDEALTIAETAASIAYNHAKSAVLHGTAPLPLICEPRALAIKANIDTVGLQFRLTYQATTQNSREIVSQDNFLGNVQTITGLAPETTYIIRLYADDALVEKVLVTTATNSIENFVVSDFFDLEEELYDISDISDHVSADVVNSLFTTGDVVEVDMKFPRRTTKETVFVKKGETIEVDRTGAVLVPFDPSTTESQESTIRLSDETSVQVALVQGEISVGGTKYASGRSFVIDGRKCTVWDI